MRTPLEKFTTTRVTNMNNSQLFKKAHKQARKTVSIVGDYQIAFTLALRELVAEQKKVVILKKSFNFEIPLICLVFTVMLSSIVIGVTVSPFHMVGLMVVGSMVSVVICGVLSILHKVYVHIVASKNKVVLNTPFEFYLMKA